ncbi:TCR gamma alternate reading frame protein [Suncus etruscus]|uniref:TCR gamma alternate reading frame protein n=1 Tax=Suncus etruscus TaxID=109475 RepID=UPI00210FA5C7|nr:TCR gamma alternate reading frame protein [Suncus etruscus]
MLSLLALLWNLLLPGSQAVTLEQRPVVIGRLGSSAILPCETRSKVSYVHWYRQQVGKAPERLLRLAMFKSDVQWDSVLKADKVTAMESKDGLSCTLSVLKLERSDESLYYCAAWDTTAPHDTLSPFGGGTKLVVADRRPGGDFSPKPTVFLPSPAEVSLHQSGTYLCLLEKFFPEVIKIDWKEENSNTMLESQQGDVVKTDDTYMKFSWLTVTENSLDKKHKCIVKHEFNRRGVDQEIIFPSIKKVQQYLSKTYFETSTVTGTVTTTGKQGGVVYTTPVLIKDESESMKEIKDLLQLQLFNNSAFYTYFVLLLKSMIYFTIIAFCLFRRTPVCSNRKISQQMMAQREENVLS